MCRFTDACEKALRREWQLLALAIVVAVVYWSRLTAVPRAGKKRGGPKALWK